MNTKLFFRAIECLLLFVGLPLVFYLDLLPIPKIAGLLFVTLLCIGVLWIDRSYILRRLSYRPSKAGQWKKMLVRGGLVAACLTVLVIFVQPERLFQFPRERPVTWFIVMILYPVLSALPQELIYREYFMHRYQTLLGSGWVLLASSAIAFSFLHIIYDNNWAIVLSLLGGFIFAQSYRDTRSLYWVTIEHALYGCLIFTIGMGNYFYEGV